MADDLDRDSLADLLPPGTLPPELAGSRLRALEAILGRQERAGVARILGEQEERGILRSGQTRQRLEEEVLVPTLERRRGALLDLLGQGVSQAREERLGETSFQRERQLRQEDFQRRIQELGQMLENQRALLRFQDELSGEEQGFDFKELGGGLLGIVTGSFFGGAGGLLGGAIGSKIAKKFS